MIGDTTIWIEIAGGSFFLMILSTIIGNVVYDVLRRKSPDLVARISVYMKLWFFFLVVALSFSLTPVIVGVFTSIFPEISENSYMSQLIAENGWLIVYGFWLVFLVGLLIAYPAMVRGGFFKEERPEG
jgi:hypothetical protein